MHHDTYYKVKPVPKIVAANKNLISLKLDHDILNHPSFSETTKQGKDHVETGFTVEDAGGEYKAFEWSGHSAQNMMYALLLRQVGTYNFPDPKMLKEFARFVKEEFRAIRPENAIPGPTFERWIETREYPAEKKRKYRASELKTKYDPEWEPKNDYDAMVKTGEVQYSKKINQDFQVQEDEKSKPRLIFVPGDTLCGTVTYLQNRVIQSMKQSFPEFAHAENSQNFWNRLEPQISKLGECYCYSMDMSAHDSHQHHTLIETVDQYMWKLHKKALLQVLIMEEYPNPEEVLNKIYRKLINNKIAKMTLFVTVDGKRRKLGVAKVKGTTFSGNPYLTTLGNTMRVILAHKFAALRAGIPTTDFVMRVAGDDAILWVKKKWKTAYEESLKTVFASDKEDKVWGLGMVLEWSRNDKNRAEFCSKVLIAENDDMPRGQWVRKPDSVLFKGNHYAGSDLKFLKNPKLYASTWAYNLQLETQGPFWTTIAAAKEAMAFGTDPDKTYMRCQVLTCKNPPDINLL